MRKALFTAATSVAALVAVAALGGAAPAQAASQTVTPLTASALSVSPNPVAIGSTASFHWTASGFPNPSLARCSDNRGWLVNAPYTGTIAKYAGADFTADFTWVVTCSDGDFSGSGSVLVRLDAAATFSQGEDAKTLQDYDSNNGDCRAGRRRTVHAQVKYAQFFGIYTYWTYYQQIKWCWNVAHTRVTYFHRDHWSGATNFGWVFNGNQATNCGPADADHCSGMTGAYSETAWTKGSYSVVIHGAPFSKVPTISQWVHADGGHGGSWSM